LSESRCDFEECTEQTEDDAPYCCYHLYMEALDDVWTYADEEYDHARSA